MHARPMESSAAGPSNSIESSTSISSGPAAFDSSRSEPQDSQEPGQEVDIRVLSRLKSPRPFDFVRNVLYMFVIVKKGHFVAGHNRHFLQHNWYVP